jgi:hypothetical protein
MPRVQAYGQEASAEDRFLRAVQRRVIQPSVPTAPENGSIITTSAQSIVTPAVESLRIIVSRSHIGRNPTWHFRLQTEAEAALQKSRNSNEDSSGIFDC